MKYKMSLCLSIFISLQFIFLHLVNSVNANPLITFKTQEIGASYARVLANIPQGEWKTFGMSGVYISTQLFGCKYEITMGCNGACEPKNWKPLVEKSEFSFYRKKEKYNVLLDEPLQNPNGHALMAQSKNGKTIEIVVVRYKDTAPRYMICRATLKGKGMQLKESFLKACKESKPLYIK